MLDIAAAYARDAAQNARVAGAATFPPPALDAPPLSRGGRGGRLHLAYVSADWTERSAVGRALRSGIAAHRRDRVRRRRRRPAPPAAAAPPRPARRACCA